MQTQLKMWKLPKPDPPASITTSQAKQNTNNRFLVRCRTDTCFLGKVVAGEGFVNFEHK